MVLAVGFLLSNSSFAGLGTHTGREWHFWHTKSGNSLVVANISSIRRVDPRWDYEMTADLTPIATIAGTFDPGAQKSLNVRFWVSFTTSSINKVPAEGALVMAMLWVDPTGQDSRTPFIDSSICKFMPGESAMVEIDGLGDQRVIETILRLKDAREHEDPSPYRTAPTSQPTSKPVEP